MEGFSSYSNYTKQNPSLHKAVRETQIFLLENGRPDHCCEMLEIKKNI